MEKVSRLSQEQEKRISKALSTVAERVNDGESPDDAIYKVAVDGGLPAGHVRLMANAYNNGRTLRQLEESRDLGDKLAEFPMADAGGILERIFPANHKTAAQKHTATVVSHDYASSPQQWIARQEEDRRKLASANIDLHEAWDIKRPQKVVTETAQRKRAWSEKLALDRSEVVARDAAISTACAAMQAFTKVAEYFHQPGGRTFPTVRENVRLVLGSKAANLCDRVAADHAELKLTKQAEAPHNVHWDTAPYSTIKAAVAAVELSIATHATWQQTAKKAEVKRRAVMRPFAKDFASIEIHGSVWERPSSLDKAASLGKMALSPSFAVGAAVAGMGKQLGKAILPDSRESQVMKLVNKLGDPVHEDKLRRIRAETMLQDLLENDPVISGYGDQYEEVLNAYNYMSELAPRAAEQRMLAQPFLRSYMERGGTVDPFEMDKLLDVENKLKKRDFMEPGSTYWADENRAVQESESRRAQQQQQAQQEHADRQQRDQQAGASA